jgi:hypothetical protein
MNTALTLVVGLAALMAITWGPTVLVYRRRRQRGDALRIPNLITALLVELAVVIVAGAVVDRLGVPNPGAYLLAIALLVGAVGGQVFARRGR